MSSDTHLRLSYRMRLRPGTGTLIDRRSWDKLECLCTDGALPERDKDRVRIGTRTVVETLEMSADCPDFNDAIVVKVGTRRDEEVLHFRNHWS
jgi:hypothetical protein